MIDRPVLDPARIRELFDLRNRVEGPGGTLYEEDPSPAWRRLRESGPVHPGTPGRLIGYEGPEQFQGLPLPDRPHFCAFDFATCDEVVRTPEIYSASSQLPGAEPTFLERSMLMMDGERHRRYRALVQPSFVPTKQGWWIRNWIRDTVDALIDSIEATGRADLNVEFCAAIPLLTICGSFGISVAQALDLRAAVTSAGTAMPQFVDLVRPIVESRRTHPQDDLISVLAHAELTEDGVTDVLTDDDIIVFSYLLLSAGSGTTWKQMGITLALLLARPEWLARVRADRSWLRPVIEEGARFLPTDPVFARFTVRDTVLAGVEIPAWSVVHPVYGAANRDPDRWEDPDGFDPGRPARPHLAFGGGPHLCLGMHVARAELETGIGALLDRLPNLRPDPDAPPPRFVGLFERGVDTVPVVWG